MRRFLRWLDRRREAKGAPEMGAWEWALLTSSMAHRARTQWMRDYRISD